MLLNCLLNRWQLVLITGINTPISINPFSCTLNKIVFYETSLASEMKKNIFILIAITRL